MHPAFAVYKLNKEGTNRSKAISEAFDECLRKLIPMVVPAEGSISAGTKDSREYARLMVNKMEEACFLARKAMAAQIDNLEVK